MATLTAKVLADFTTSLATSIIIGGTTATLQSATDDDGIALPAGRYFFTLDGSNSSKEHISCTLSGTSLTGIKSVSRQGVETSGVVRAHRIGCTVTLTDFAHLKVINDLVSGTTNFNASVPLGYDGTATISTANQFATKAYADSLAIAGAGNADTTTQGLVQIAVQSEVDAGTATGSSGASLVATPALVRGKLINDYAVDSSGTDAYEITITPAITSYTAGQRFSFKAGTANTGACTLNVSGLGAKTIKKDVSSDLATGDILANQIVEVEYDGTNMQLLSKTPQGSVSLTSQVTGVLPVANGGTGLATLNYNSVVQAGAVSSTTVIAHGLGKTPAHIRIHCYSTVGSGTMGSINSVGTYNGTSNKCLFNTQTTGGSGQIIGAFDSSNIIYLEVGSGATYTKGVATMDATNVTITWTSFNGGIANVLLLEAWGI